jgi:peptidoglycan/xylan/chitin deacetylase (PgdA/CDA1 family)
LSSFVDRRHLVEYPPDRKQRNDEIREEIARCRDLLIQLTGSPGAFFRTSSGQHASALILAEAGAAGYPVTLSYDVDPQD